MGWPAEIVFGRGANRFGPKRELIENATLAGIASEDLSLVVTLLRSEGAIENRRAGPIRRRQDRRHHVFQKTFRLEARRTGVVRGKLEQREGISEQSGRGMDGGCGCVMVRMSSFVRMGEDHGGPNALKNVDEREGDTGNMKARLLIGPFETKILRARYGGYFERPVKFAPAKGGVRLPGVAAGIANVIARTGGAVSHVYDGGEIKPGELSGETNDLIVGMRSDDNGSTGH